MDEDGYQPAGDDDDTEDVDDMRDTIKAATFGGLRHRPNGTPPANWGQRRQ